MLAIDIRPKTLEEVLGQNIVTIPLAAMIQKDKVPTAIILSGPKGAGKTSVARILASQLTDELGVIEIDAATHGGVAEVRQLVNQLQYSVAWNRIVIYDEAQDLSREAFDALLKVIEEPPIGVYFILVTTAEHKIPETISSRCISFQFKKLNQKVIFDKLVELAPELDEELLKVVTDKVDGSFRSALMELDKLLLSEIKSVDDYYNYLGESDFAPSLVELLAAGQLAATFEFLKSTEIADYLWVQDSLVLLFKELAVLKSGQSVPYQGSRLVRREALASKLSSVKIVSGLKVLWDAKTKIKATEDPKIIVDLVLVMLSEGLNV